MKTIAFEKIYLGILLITVLSFLYSFALLSIAVFALIPLCFLIDKRTSYYERWKAIRRDPVVLAFGLLWLWQLIGTLYSADQAMAWKRVSAYLPFLYLPGILLSARLTADSWSLFLRWSSRLLLLGLNILLGYFLLASDRSLSYFVNFIINDLLGLSQFYVLFSMIIPLWYGNLCLQNKNWLEGWLVLLNSIFFITLLGNRTVILFFLLASIYYLVLLFKRNYRKGTVVTIASFVLGALLWSTPWVKNRLQIIQRTTDIQFEVIKTKNSFIETKNTLEYRILIQAVSWKAIFKRPLGGYGTGDVQRVLNQGYEELQFKAGIRSKLNAHNQYLEEGLKGGLIGMSLFIFLLVQLYKRTMSGNDLGSITVLLFAVCCLTESYLNRQHGIVIAAFLIPLLISNSKRQPLDE